MSKLEKIDLDLVNKENQKNTNKIAEDKFNEKETVEATEEATKNLSQEAMNSDSFESKKQVKTIEELESDIASYREQIRSGEQKDENGNYDEKKF